MKNWQRALFVVLAIIGALLTLQIKGALAQDTYGDTYHMTPDDFGFYPPEGTQDCTPFGSIESIPDFCFQPNFLQYLVPHRVHQIAYPDVVWRP